MCVFISSSLLNNLSHMSQELNGFSKCLFTWLLASEMLKNASSFINSNLYNQLMTYFRLFLIKESCLLFKTFEQFTVKLEQF